jgi:acyl-CoA thioesterase
VNPFDADTALVPIGENRWRAEVREHWFIERGPNGGLFAAQATRAMTLLAADPAREPRSLTVHYLEAPTAGPVEVVGRVERAGRSTTAVAVRFEQGGRTVALALGALAVWRDGGLDHLEGSSAPKVPPPEELAPVSQDTPGLPVFIGNYDWRWVTEPQAEGAPPTARGGGWLRTREPRPVDAIALAAFADAFPPPVFAILGRPAPAPTVDLTIHWRAPASALPRDGWALAAFRSHRVAGGCFEEDGELWSRDGTLLAQSRQLALLRERTGAPG